MDDKLSDIFAFILSSDKVSVEDAEIIRCLLYTSHW